MGKCQVGTNIRSKQTSRVYKLGAKSINLGPLLGQNKVKSVGVGGNIKSESLPGQSVQVRGETSSRDHY